MKWEESRVKNRALQCLEAREVTAKLQASGIESSLLWDPHVGGAVEASSLWESVGDWAGLEVFF